MPCALHPLLSLPSSLRQWRWMHREGVAEGEENRCSVGAHGGEAVRRRKPTALRAAIAAPCPRDPYLGQERHRSLLQGAHSPLLLGDWQQGDEGGARWRRRRRLSFQGQLRRRRMARSSSSKTASWNREAHVDGKVGGAEEDNIGDNFLSSGGEAMRLSVD
uniref:Uncharacterized protein n=1 Tax=Oryza meridionalis TaxID=40149 RepID=A0A0E0DPT2_9ORYZ